jgi:hypothetical protein
MLQGFDEISVDSSGKNFPFIHPFFLTLKLLRRQEIFS